MEFQSMVELMVNTFLRRWRPATHSMNDWTLWSVWLEDTGRIHFHHANSSACCWSTRRSIWWNKTPLQANHVAFFLIKADFGQSLPPQGIIERVNLLADVICITQAEPLAKDDNKTSVSRTNIFLGRNAINLDGMSKTRWLMWRDAGVVQVTDRRLALTWFIVSIAPCTHSWAEFVKTCQDIFPHRARLMYGAQIRVRNKISAGSQVEVLDVLDTFWTRFGQHVFKSTISTLASWQLTKRGPISRDDPRPIRQLPVMEVAPISSRRPWRPWFTVTDSPKSLSMVQWFVACAQDCTSVLQKEVVWVGNSRNMLAISNISFAFLCHHWADSGIRAKQKRKLQWLGPGEGQVGGPQVHRIRSSQSAGWNLWRWSGDLEEAKEFSVIFNHVSHILILTYFNLCPIIDMEAMVASGCVVQHVLRSKVFTNRYILVWCWGLLLDGFAVVKLCQTHNMSTVHVQCTMHEALLYRDLGSSDVCPVGSLDRPQPWKNSTHWQNFWRIPKFWRRMVNFSLCLPGCPAGKQWNIAKWQVSKRLELRDPSESYR